MYLLTARACNTNEDGDQDLYVYKLSHVVFRKIYVTRGLQNAQENVEWLDIFGLFITTKTDEFKLLLMVRDSVILYYDIVIENRA